MHLLLFVPLAAAQTAAGPNGAWFTALSGGGAYIMLDCRNTPAASQTATQTLQVVDFAWARTWILASIHNFESEIAISYGMGTFKYGAAVTSNALSVSVSDSHGPVKVYDPARNEWTTAPVVFGYGENNVDSSVFVRLHRRADFDTLTLTASATASGTCLGTDGGDQGYAFAGVHTASLGYW